ncbi:unnamed protein product [Knipowitschia caucasica]
MWLLNLDYLLILCGLFFVLCTSYRTIEPSVLGAGALPRLTFTRESLLQLRFSERATDPPPDIPPELRKTAAQPVRRKRGRREGRLGLQDRRQMPALPSILLGNAQSLRVKLDELDTWATVRQEITNACLLVFTEYWLKHTDRDEDLSVRGFGAPYRLDRDQEIIGKLQYNTIYSCIALGHNRSHLRDLTKPLKSPTQVRESTVKTHEEYKAHTEEHVHTCCRMLKCPDHHQSFLLDTNCPTRPSCIDKEQLLKNPVGKSEKPWGELGKPTGRETHLRKGSAPPDGQANDPGPKLATERGPVAAERGQVRCRTEALPGGSGGAVRRCRWRRPGSEIPSSYHETDNGTTGE